MSAIKKKNLTLCFELSYANDPVILRIPFIDVKTIETFTVTTAVRVIDSLL